MLSAFDKASKNYDDGFTFSNIGKAQRQVVYTYLNRIFKTNEKLDVLEVNCGTGEDAIYIANQNHNVLATDLSLGMVEIAKTKSYESNLEFKPLDVKAIGKEFKPNSFNVLFSNFGGLNCIDNSDLKAFIQDANTILRPKGKLIMVIMPKHCLWETIFFLFRGKVKQAFRRYTDDYLIANVEGVQVKTWYYNPKKIELMANQGFKTILIKPIGITIPPTYLQGSILSKPFILKILSELERLFSISALSKYADHFIIELEKK